MGSRQEGVEIRGTSIRITFTLDGVKMKRTLKVNGKPLLPNPANLKMAGRLALEIRRQIDDKTFVLGDHFPDGDDATVGRGTTVAKHLELWLSTLRIAKSTKRAYTAGCNFWKSRIGDKSLRQLKHSDILLAIASRPDLGGKTLNNYISNLREALDLAVRDKLISENPVVDVPRASYQPPIADPFSMEELERILASTHKHYPGQIENLFGFKFFSGVRTSEAAGLRWPDVDLVAGEVLVHEAVVEGDRKDSTKTSTSRVLKLNDRALAYLKDQRQHSQAAAGCVFLDPRYQTPWESSSVLTQAFWTPALRRAGVRYRRPYNTRHSYATMMLMAGRTPAWCAKQLGHSVELFLRTYARWIDGDQDDREVGAINDWIKRANSK